ncbi:hypothetical protein LGK95_01140 [Clostridium algoriphilum]|uniref:hypothetical protein n=1 Tax=Clostridium algoriphilum TaxID=198347 RepID=UPI001CF4CD97|nr:hypothetical protein [Clostridium algoriphilum]MCB2292144.1 hypothetical protein [Clostridium algoriphilum]
MPDEKKRYVGEITEEEVKNLIKNDDRAAKENFYFIHECYSDEAKNQLVADLFKKAIDYGHNAEKIK